ncbi:MAG TPA: polyprenyl synthetase family protein [bacterium]|nr:polyprenyl synthetase family protein [bacterium]HPN29922.1 polyprenyl synthetase family protein [bacterium]
MKKNITIEKYLVDRKKIIETNLEKYLKCSDADIKIIFDSMGYSVLAGGKRLRPLLVLLTAETFGGNSGLKKAVPAACAIEMIHTYSLIHDDLPCMDNDDFRRGKLTNHKKFGENIAVLAGDGLLTYAFYVVSKFSCVSICGELIKLLSFNSGVDGMLGGQTLDVILENKKIRDITVIDKIHLKKTAALIKCSILIGAVCGGVSDKIIMNSLEKAGNNLGLAFQIIDDILDLTATTEELGKPSKSDLKKNKSTYPSILGIKKSEKIALQLLENTVKLLKKLPIDSGLLIDLAKMLVLRKK